MATLIVQDTADFGATIMAGDTVNVTGKSTKNTTNVTTNVDQSALGAGGIANVFVAPDFVANLGSFSNPLKFETGTLFNYNAGGGSLWYVPNGDSNVCAKFRQLGPNTVFNAQGTGTLTVFEQLAGRSVLGSGIAATTMRVAGGHCTLDGASGTSPTTVYVGGNGVLHTERGIAGGGNLYIFDRGKVIMDAGSDTIPTVWMFGGTFDLGSSGTITTMHVLGGDAGQIKLGRAVTITTLNIWPTVRNRDKFLNNEYLTVTNLNKDISPIAIPFVQAGFNAA